MTPVAARPPTLPTIAGYQLQAAGHTWDAIRVPHLPAQHVLARLGEDTGAVIDDPYQAVLYWFLSAGAARDWTVPGTVPLALGQHLVVPPADRLRGPGPHWRVSPTGGRFLTSAHRLRACLRDMARHREAR